LTLLRLPAALAARLRSLGRLTARGLPGVRVMQVGRADAPATEEFQTLGEDLLQLIDRTPLQQHVPMRTSRFVGVSIRGTGVVLAGLRATTGTLPCVRDLRILRHRDLELVPARAVVGHVLAGGELDTVLVLEAGAAQP